MATVETSNSSMGSSRGIEKVIVVGAGGRLGQHITTALFQTGKHTVTALTRPSSQNSFGPGVRVVKADYDDHDTLVKAMQGHDALVVTMSNAAPADSIARLCEAAIEARVPWILPNEWGYDYLDTGLNADLSDFGLGTAQLAVRHLIETKGTPVGTGYVAVACGFWYDYSLSGGEGTLGFDLRSKTVTFYDDGSVRRYFSTLPYCAEAVAKLLSLPVTGDGHGPCLSDYRNQIVRVHTFTASQRDMLDCVLRVTGTERSEWAVKSVGSKARFEEARAQFRAGDRWAARRMLYARAFYPGKKEVETASFQDRRLGLSPVSLDAATRDVIRDLKSE